MNIEDNRSIKNFETMLIGSMFFALLNGTIYLFMEGQLSNVLLSYGSGGILFIMYLLYKNNIGRKILPYLFVCFIYLLILPAGWLTTYGSKGPMVIYLFLFLQLTSFIVRTKLSAFISLLGIVEIVLLWLLEPLYHSLIDQISGTYNIPQNMFMHFIIASIIILFFIFMDSRVSIRLGHEYKKLTMTDYLTGINNRRHFHYEVEAMLTNKKIHNIWLILFDIDNFKLLNDLYGHTHGDLILVEFANILRQTVREADIPCRYGGDEFVVAITNCNHDTIMSILDRVIQTFNQITTSYPQAHLDLSHGIVEVGNLSLEKALQLADANMYAQKHTHKQAEKEEG